MCHEKVRRSIFFFQAEDGIRDLTVTGVQTCALPIYGTALYNLGTALIRSGARGEGQRLMQQFQTLRESGAATTVGQSYLEQGRYAEAVRSEERRVGKGCRSRWSTCGGRT